MVNLSYFENSNQTKLFWLTSKVIKFTFCYIPQTINKFCSLFKLNKVNIITIGKMCKYFLVQPEYGWLSNIPIVKLTPGGWLSLTIVMFDNVELTQKGCWT
jgi:hypothetical protein